jgi:hypothetical protein
MPVVPGEVPTQRGYITVGVLAETYMCVGRLGARQATVTSSQR